jgi:dTDP-4-amino-4,6-dideoxygalactose transaminase
VKIPLNDLSRVDPEQLKIELGLVEEILRRGVYLKSDFTKQFEESISQRVGKQYTLAVGNGTDALRLAFAGLGLKRGDLILTTPNAGGYATSAAKSLDLNVGFVDINESDHQMSVDSLLNFLDRNPKVKAIVVTHLYGQMGDIEQISEICSSRNILVIEDCAQSYGAKKSGFSAGYFGDAATFSFYPTKNLGAAGDAGAVSFRSKSNFDCATSISQYGWVDRYSIENKNGFNSRIDEIQAAILLNRSELLDIQNVKRREIVKIYRENLKNFRLIIGSDEESFVGHLAVLVLPKREIDRRLLESAGISCGIHYPILDFHQTAWTENLIDSSCPVAEVTSKQILTIPCYPTLTENEIAYICNNLSLL